MYANAEFETLGLPLSSKQVGEYSNQDEVGQKFQWRDLRKRGGTDTKALRPKLHFSIYIDPNTGECSMERTERHSLEVLPEKGDGTPGCWRWGSTKVSASVSQLKATKVAGKERWNVSYRIYLESNGRMRVAKPKSVWFGPELSTDAAIKALKALIPGAVDFTAKSVDLLKTICIQALEEDDLALDFFAGSATLGQAIMELNKSDGVSRSFICIQLPEQLAEQIELFARSEKDGARVEDILYELLLKFGQELTTPVETLEFTLDHEQTPFPQAVGAPSDPLGGAKCGGHSRVFAIHDRQMLFVLEAFSAAMIQPLVDLKPREIIAIDGVFHDSDTLKTNLDLQCRDAGIKFTCL